MEVHNTLTVGERSSSLPTPSKCKICGKEFSNTKSLRTHLNLIHNITGYIDWYKYLIDYENFIVPKCPYCGNDCKLGSRRGYRHTCGNKECTKKYLSSVQKSIYVKNPELRKLHQKIRINFLKEKCNRDKTAWANRNNSKLSYLERIFVDEYILPNNLQNKYEIINEYSEYPYFLDFAFVDIKVDVELDGRCHFTNGNERIEHDIIRDKELVNKGWAIYRIDFNEINNKETKNNFLNFINSYKEYNYDPNRQLLKYHQYKEKKILKKKIKQIKNKIKQNIEKQKLESKIHDILINIGKENDLTKFGWCTLVQNKLKENNIYVVANIRRYINKHCPEFFKLYKVYNKKFNK